MRIAKLAFHSGAAHAKSAVSNGRHIFFGNWLVKTGPAGAGLKLGIRAEERRATAHAAIDPRLMVVPVLAGKSHLRAIFARYIVSARRKLLLPLALTLHHLGNVHLVFALTGIGKLHNINFLRSAA